MYKLDVRNTLFGKIKQILIALSVQALSTVGAETTFLTTAPFDLSGSSSGEKIEILN